VTEQIDKHQVEVFFVFIDLLVIDVGIAAQAVQKNDPVAVLGKYVGDMA
jgi:hypothetical protein